MQDSTGASAAVACGLSVQARDTEKVRSRRALPFAGEATARQRHIMAVVADDGLFDPSLVARTIEEVAWNSEERLR